jgi:hypothetical protein
MNQNCGRLIYSIADLIEQRIYWTDYYNNSIKSAKVDGSDVQLITSEVTNPMGIDIHDNYIYFTENYGKLYKELHLSTVNYSIQYIFQDKS